jgi:hypothetical protein
MAGGTERHQPVQIEVRAPLGVLSLFSENVIPPGVSVTARQGEDRPRAEGVPSGADVGVEGFCDVAGAVACPPNTLCVSSLLATQLGGDTFTDQLEG